MKRDVVLKVKDLVSIDVVVVLFVHASNDVVLRSGARFHLDLEHRGLHVGFEVPCDYDHNLVDLIFGHYLDMIVFIGHTGAIQTTDLNSRRELNICWLKRNLFIELGYHFAGEKGLFRSLENITILDESATVDHA